MSSKSAISKTGFASPEVAAIENELPTYRAISPLAVASVVAGLVGLLCYTNLWFMISGGCAILLGILAIRKINRQPDVFTGRGLAQAGIVLALISSLSSVTISAVQGLLVSQSAERFVKNELISVLDSHDLDSALWWKTEPDSRKGLEPADIRKRYENPNERNAAMFEMMAGAVARLIRDLKAHPQAKLTFKSIEQTGVDGLTPYAIAIIRIDWPKEQSDQHPEHSHKERGDLMGVILKSKREGRRELWWVEDYIYPYVENSYQEKVKPVDDGHGHAH